MEDAADSSLHHDPKPKGLMVILVGAPGSDKSTFCSEVMNTSNRSWVRVCQDLDAIENGRVLIPEYLKEEKTESEKRAEIERQRGTPWTEEEHKFEKEFIFVGDFVINLLPVTSDLYSSFLTFRRVRN